MNKDNLYLLMPIMVFLITIFGTLWDGAVDDKRFRMRLMQSLGWIGMMLVFIMVKLSQLHK